MERDGLPSRWEGTAVRHHVFLALFLLCVMSFGVPVVDTGFKEKETRDP